MNRRLLLTTTIALSVVGATAVVLLLVTGKGTTPGKNGADVGNGTASTLPPALGRDQQELSAGTQVFDLTALDTARTGSVHLPKIAITLPSGWSNYEGYAVTTDHLGLAFWDVRKVYSTPCHWRADDMVDPGATVTGLASVLARQPLRNATTPTNVVLSGARGKYLQLSVPQHITFAQCHKGYFESWTGRGWATDRWEQGPGMVDRIWILNVDGQRLVVDANYLPSATAKERAELDRIVRSIRFIGPAAHSAAPVALLTAASHVPSRRVAGRGPWIAYSTAPIRNPLSRGYYGLSGSDVFITQPDRQPQLVAWRGKRGAIWNVCPSFSPNGRLLAFARKAPGNRAIIVVGIGRDGTLGQPSVTLKVAGRTPCPRWLPDSYHLAYVGRGNAIVVVGLDGSTRDGGAGDPTIREFRWNQVASAPDRGLVARLSNAQLVTSRPDGSDRRVIKRYRRESPYAIAGWSPDGRDLLVMRDMGGGFEMRAVSINAPFRTEQVVAFVEVNNARSWPGHGDVSWQPSPSAG